MFFGDTNYYNLSALAPCLSYVVVDSNGCLGSSDSLVRCPDRIQNQELNNPEATIFPNPVKNDLFIASDTRVGHITIIDLLGRVVYNESYDEKKVQIDVSKLPPCIFLLRRNDSENKKLIKQ